MAKLYSWEPANHYAEILRKRRDRGLYDFNQYIFYVTLIAEWNRTFLLQQGEAQWTGRSPHGSTR